jgi:hypothetical protein
MLMQSIQSDVEESGKHVPAISYRAALIITVRINGLPTTPLRVMGLGIKHTYFGEITGGGK